MTPKQSALLNFLRDYQLEHDGVSPSMREMADALGLVAVSGACRLIGVLEQQGLVQRDRAGGRGATRGIRVVQRGADLAGVSSVDLLAECRRRGLEVAA